MILKYFSLTPHTSSPLKLPYEGVSLFEVLHSWSLPFIYISRFNLLPKANEIISRFVTSILATVTRSCSTLCECYLCITRCL